MRGIIGSAACLGLLVLAALAVLCPQARADTISSLKTLRLTSYVSDIVVDPTRAVAYLSARDSGTVSVFSFATLDIEQEIPVGAQPARMDLDPTTDRLYVGLGGGSGVAVVNVTSRATVAVWPAGGPISDVAVGRPGRLYVTMGASASDGRMKVLDTLTGAVVANMTVGYPSRGLLAISPDESTLYVGGRDVVPTSLMRVDVTTDNATFLSADDGTLGGNLRDLVLSPDGTQVYLAAAYPYGIEIVDATSLRSTGLLDTGAFPSAVAVSGDGTLILGGKDDWWFYSFRAGTPANLDTLRATSSVETLALDATGNVILAFSLSPTSEDFLDVYLGLYSGAPSVTILSPVPDAYVGGANVDVWVRLLDPDGVDATSIVLSVDGATVPFVSWDDLRKEAHGSPGNLSDGFHTASAGARDLRGNGPRLVRWEFVVDATGPSLVVSSPVEGARYRPGPVTIAWFTTDNASGVAYVEVIIDGVSSTAGTSESRTVDIEQEGTHVVRIKAFDLVGNAAVSSVTFVVKGPDPFDSLAGWPPPGILAAVVAASAVGAGVALAWVLGRGARKQKRAA